MLDKNMSVINSYSRLTNLQLMKIEPQIQLLSLC